MTNPITDTEAATSPAAPPPLQAPRLVHPQRLQPHDIGLTRLGVSVMRLPGARAPGPQLGQAAPHPGQPAHLEGQQYLVAPRGETQWVRNVRNAGGHMVLILGRRRQLCTATEIPVEDSVPILRSYLKLEVRDRDVLRRRHARLERRRVGRRGRPSPGLRTLR